MLFTVRSRFFANSRFPHNGTGSSSFFFLGGLRLVLMPAWPPPLPTSSFEERCARWSRRTARFARMAGRRRVWPTRRRGFDLAADGAVLCSASISRGRLTRGRWDCAMKASGLGRGLVVLSGDDDDDSRLDPSSLSFVMAPRRGPTPCALSLPLRALPPRRCFPLLACGPLLRQVLPVVLLGA